MAIKDVRAQTFPPTGFVRLWLQVENDKIKSGLTELVLKMRRITDHFQSLDAILASFITIGKYLSWRVISKSCVFNRAYIGLFDRSLLHMSLNQLELALKNAMSDIYRLHTTDYRLQQGNSDRGLYWREDDWGSLAANLEDWTELNPTRIVVVLKLRLFDHIKDDICVDSETLKKGILTYDNEPFSLPLASFLKDKNGNEHNNGRRAFTLIWMPGTLLLPVVYQHSPWIHKQIYRGEVVFSGTVYVEGQCPS